MDKNLLFLMGIAVLITIPLVNYLIEIIDLQQKRKKNFGASLAEKPQKDIYRRLYHFFRRRTLTAGRIEQVRRMYELMYPGDEEDIQKKTVGTVSLTWGICLIAVGFIFLLHPSFNNAAVALLLVFVLNTEIVSHLIAATEQKILEEMALFLSNVRHSFYINQMVDDAILLALQETSGIEMKTHANKIYEVISSCDLKTSVTAYNATMHNRYMKMFLSLCVNVMEYGDKDVNGQKLFTANLDNLKKEINNEIIKVKKIRYKFAGLTFVAIAVCVPIDGIKAYGLSMLPEMDSFYNGSYGIIYVTFTLITAFVVYLMNNNLKETKRPMAKDYSGLKLLEKIKVIRNALDNYIEKNYSRMMKIKDILKRIGENISPRQFLLKRMIYAVLACGSSILFLFYLHEVNRHNLTDKVIELPESIIAVNETQAGLIKDAILLQVEIHLEEQNPVEQIILKEVTGLGTFYSANINEGIAKEVVRRIHLYYEEYFMWYELLISIGIGILAFFIPYWLLLYQRSIQEMNMEDEVSQLNSIIFMLMYSNHITVKDLLEEMELFAVVFKQTIQECINDYNSGDLEALERMKEREAFGPFKRLVSNLIRCDNMAIYMAFDEIAADRENYHERRKLENEISVQKRSDRAQLQSYLPAVLVLIYLILPMIVTGIESYLMFQEMMSVY